ncbi:ribonuclease III [Thermaerobacter marianensis DSM 12885]|uniref:Ribonuclease 3 n=1 Tax=Thermaerobacter marianensis (strain ATCC 700841 / DSM 12885 / JCM 10246 / 7p75a) TaxID=644966 RepID=E6SJD7_THEM7|nr:ribonuclease III [Thermaerobacter marianensis]ADU51065.1 ribonuclease III [Thermaerobacter marianensis DSM 12885]
MGLDGQQRDAAAGAGTGAATAASTAAGPGGPGDGTAGTVPPDTAAAGTAPQRAGPGGGGAGPSRPPRAGEPGWLQRVAELTGTEPRRPELFLEALTHASYRAEHPDTAGADNERLEFLGDAVLNLCVTDHIFRTYPQRPEGELSKLRAATVRAETLAVTAQRLGLGELLRLGRGEEATGGRQRPSVLADAFEAVVAAVYLQEGLEGARAFILRTLGDEIRRLAESSGACDDPKTALQELSRRLGLGEPSYRVIDASGPEHDPRYTVEVRVGGRPLGQAVGRSKKVAEREAARIALADLEEPAAGAARPAGDAGAAGSGASRAGEEPAGR